MFGDPVNNPKSWPSTRLLDVCEKITDGEHLNPKFEKTGVPIAMAGDVLKSGINFEKVKFVSQKDFEKFSRKCLPEHNDLLLVSRGATIGRCSLVNTTRPFSLMGSVILIKPKRDLVCPYFLANLFWHPGYKAKLYKTSSSSAQQAIYLTHLRELTIPLPSLKAQKKFELLCEKIFSMISQRINYELKTRDLFNSLTQRAFRGEL
jgi:type I restriction enzyme S subunit